MRELVQLSILQLAAELDSSLQLHCSYLDWTKSHRFYTDSEDAIVRKKQTYTEMIRIQVAS